MASTPFRQGSLAADKPPPSWKRSGSYIKVRARSGDFGDEEPQPPSPVHQPSSPDPAQKLPLDEQSADTPAVAVDPLPVSPGKSLADVHIQTASTPRTPRIAPPPPPTVASDSTPDLPPRQDSLTTASSGGHRKTISWGGSPTAAGKVHRRSRSTDSSHDAKEAYRQQLERIGSMDRAPSGGSSSLVSSPHAASIGSPTAPASASQLAAQRAPPLMSPAKPPSHSGENGLEHAKGPSWAPPAPKPVKVKAMQSKKEPELISWDEVEQQKDVYQAITTADGRQALVKASTGKNGQEELLFLSDLQPPQPAQTHSSEAYSTVFAIPGTVPMMAVPVQYPDGRIMYHVYPLAQHPGQASQSPGGTPVVLSPRVHAAAASSPQYPTSPTSSAPAGHQRRPSLSTPSPLQAGSVPMYSGPATFSSGFSTAPSTTSLSPAGSGQLYSVSSGPQSPQLSLSHANSGHLYAAAVPSSASIKPMSPASSGQLYTSVPSAYAPAANQQYSVPAGGQAALMTAVSPPLPALHQQLGSMHIGAKASQSAQDPFGGSAVW